MLVDRSARVWAMRRDDVMNVQALEFRAAVVAGEQPAAAAGPGQLLEGSYFARVIDGAAVIPVRGPLMRTFSYWAWSYEELRRDIDLALAEPSVKSIILDIDSPGGLVAGCDDCAAFIRGVTEKPITAFVGGLGTSAAYWLAAATSEIHLGSGALVGSIGSLIEYVDFEPMFEKMGARMIRVVAEQSPNKRLDPESAEGKAEMQAIVNASCAAFVTAVAGFRGVSEAKVLEEFGKGLMFAADDAIRRGMADGRSTLETMVAELAGRNVKKTPAPAAPTMENHMTTSLITPPVRQVAAAATQLTENVNAPLDQRAKTRWDRDVAQRAEFGDDFASFLAFETASGAGLARVRGADPVLSAPVMASTNAGPRQAPVSATANLPHDHRLTSAWNTSPALRAEFGDDFEAYAAFEKANAAGLTKIFQRG